MATRPRSRPPKRSRTCCPAAAQIEDALLHFWIAAESYSAHLPTDWGFVASKMYEALTEPPDRVADGAPRDDEGERDHREAGRDDRPSW